MLEELSMKKYIFSETIWKSVTRNSCHEHLKIYLRNLITKRILRGLIGSSKIEKIEKH